VDSSWKTCKACKIKDFELVLDMMETFYPNVFVQVAGNLGEIAARHQIHLNCFEPLVKNKSLPVQVRRQLGLKVLKILYIV